jgi:hypothetical protein
MGRSSVATNAATPPKIHKSLAEDGDECVRFTSRVVAATPTDAIAHLSGDQGARARTVAKNPATPTVRGRFPDVPQNIPARINEWLTFRAQNCQQASRSRGKSCFPNKGNQYECDQWRQQCDDPGHGDEVPAGTAFGGRSRKRTGLDGIGCGHCVVRVRCGVYIHRRNRGVEQQPAQPVGLI